MAKPRAVVIDGEWTMAGPKDTLADVAPAGALSVTTRDGKLIPREDFERTPIPDGFESNLSTINKGEDDHNASRDFGKG